MCSQIVCCDIREIRIVNSRRTAARSTDGTIWGSSEWTEAAKVGEARCPRCIVSRGGVGTRGPTHSILCSVSYLGSSCASYIAEEEVEEGADR